MAQILVLESDVCLRNVIRECLEQEGYTVIEAHNDYEGLPRDQVAPTDVAQTDIRYLVTL